MNWILMSTLGRALVVATGIALAAVVVLLVLGLPNPTVIFAALALVIVSVVIHRRDMERAIARQLQRDADEAAGQATDDHEDGRHP